MILYHIPKTAGTALKNAFITNGRHPFQIPSTHGKTLFNSDDTDVCFILRDPLERFCSAFWERRTNPLRRELNEKVSPQFKRGGYRDLTETEKEWFRYHDTPDKCITGIRHENLEWQQVLKSSQPMVDLFSPLVRFFGTLDQFQTQEHRIRWVFDQQHLTDIMSTYFNISMPTEPFLARSRAQFDMEQSYDISTDNEKWFKTDYRADDYQLMEYIKTRPYYIKEGKQNV